MAVPRGTTPTFLLTTNSQTVDWTAAEHVYCTFRQGNHAVTKEDEDLEIAERQISVWFSQQETLGFKAKKPVEVQVNWTLGEGQRAATEIVTVTLSENLIGTVIA